MCLNGQSNRAFFQTAWILTTLTLFSFQIVRRPFIRDGEFWRLILLLSRKPSPHHPLFTASHRQWILFNSDSSGTLKQKKCVSNSRTMAFHCVKGKQAWWCAQLPWKQHFLSFSSLSSLAVAVRIITVLKKEGIVCDPRKMVEDNTPPPICINVYGINKEMNEWNHLPFLETICLVSYDIFNLLFIGLNFHIIRTDTQVGLNTSIQNKRDLKCIWLKGIQIIWFPFVLHPLLWPQAAINHHNYCLNKTLKERLQQGTSHASKKSLHENSSKCCLWLRFLDSKASLRYSLVRGACRK